MAFSFVGCTTVYVANRDPCPRSEFWLPGAMMDPRPFYAEGLVQLHDSDVDPRVFERLNQLERYCWVNSAR